MRLLNTTGHDRVAARRLIVQRLQACQAINIKALCENAGIDSYVAKRELDYLIENKEVEVLRPLPPVSEFARNNRAMADAAEGAEHFRLIRDTDENYLWEQGVVTRFPVSRMSQDYSYAKRDAVESRRKSEVSLSWLRRVASFAFAGF